MKKAIGIIILGLLVCTIPKQAKALFEELGATKNGTSDYVYIKSAPVGWESGVVKRVAAEWCNRYDKHAFFYSGSWTFSWTIAICSKDYKPEITLTRGSKKGKIGTVLWTNYVDPKKTVAEKHEPKHVYWTAYAKLIGTGPDFDSFKKVRSGKVTDISDQQTYFKAAFNGVMKACKNHHSFTGHVCKVTTIKYSEKDNRDEEQRLTIQSGIFMDSVKVGWNGMEGELVVGTKKKPEPKTVAKKPTETKPDDQTTKEPQSSDINPDLITIGSGSGFYINNKGYALTNSHVVEICEQVITIVEGQKILFHIIANDEIIDIGLVKSTKKNSNYLRIETDGAKLGEDVIAVGYPLSGQLSDSVKITKGIVSSLSGLGNNSAQIQIDAALQPGNSGGPIINTSGDVVGIASAGLNKLLMAKETKYIPENVNFAVAAPSLATFLKAKKIKYSTGSFFSKEYSTHELAEIGQDSTIQLLCLNTRAAYAELKRSKKYRDVLLDIN